MSDFICNLTALKSLDNRKVESEDQKDFFGKSTNSFQSFFQESCDVREVLEFLFILFFNLLPLLMENFSLVVYSRRCGTQEARISTGRRISLLI